MYDGEKEVGKCWRYSNLRSKKRAKVCDWGVWRPPFTTVLRNSRFFLKAIAAATHVSSAIQTYQ